MNTQASLLKSTVIFVSRPVSGDRRFHHHALLLASRFGRATEEMYRSRSNTELLAASLDSRGLVKQSRSAAASHVTSAGNTDQPFIQFKEFSTTQLFRVWIQGAVFLVVLAAVDAAFSGDWSRTGVISKDFENSLKPLVVALGLFHFGCAVVAARSAASKNLNVAPAVLKVLAVGFLAMVEILLKDANSD